MGDEKMIKIDLSKAGIYGLGWTIDDYQTFTIPVHAPGQGVIVNWSFNPPEPYVGQEVTITATFKNEGAKDKFRGVIIWDTSGVPEFNYYPSADGNYYNTNETWSGTLTKTMPNKDVDVEIRVERWVY